MNPRTQNVSCLLIGAGIGLLAALLFPGWFFQLLIGLVLILIGCLCSGCC